MSLRNNVALIGRTGKEVEIVNFENGSLAKVTLATSDYFTNKNGERVEDTQWHNLIAFGKNAEILERYVQLGDQIAINGKIVYRQYDDKDGNRRYFTEIRVNRVLLLEKKAA